MSADESAGMRDGSSSPRMSALSVSTSCDKRAGDFKLSPVQPAERLRMRADGISQKCRRLDSSFQLPQARSKTIVFGGRPSIRAMRQIGTF
jgi:hypothetical protein